MFLEYRKYIIAAFLMLVPVCLYQVLCKEVAVADEYGLSGQNSIWI